MTDNKFKLVGESITNNLEKEIIKPNKLNKTVRQSLVRSCLYINNFPIISIGSNIEKPLIIMLFFSITYLIFFYIGFELLKLLYQKIFLIAFTTYFITHFLAIFINPGIVRNNNKNIESNCNKCLECNLSYKKLEEVKHCKICDVCYYKHKYHSSWIGHCVTNYNLILILTYKFSFIIFVVFGLLMIVARLYRFYLTFQ